MAVMLTAFFAISEQMLASVPGLCSAWMSSWVMRAIKTPVASVQLSVANRWNWGAGELNSFIPEIAGH
jgi:hypothetical protein